MTDSQYLELIKIATKEIEKLTAEKDLINLKIKAFNLTIEKCADEMMKTKTGENVESVIVGNCRFTK